MCLIAYQPSGVGMLDKAAMRNGWDGNSDGAGYMFAANGKLTIRKPFWKFKQFWKSYKSDYAANPQSAFVLHFRWSTHGAMDSVNTHPHELCNGRIGLVHNGMLPIEPPFKSDISDTVYFCRTVLAHRPLSQLMSEDYGVILAELIGVANKFVLLDELGNVSIVNEKSGLWDGDYWFSNASYLPAIRTPMYRWGKRVGSLFDADDLKDDCVASPTLEDLAELQAEEDVQEWLARHSDDADRLAIMSDADIEAEIEEMALEDWLRTRADGDERRIA